jgi:hypothetical protein
MLPIIVAPLVLFSVLGSHPSVYSLLCEQGVAVFSFPYQSALDGGETDTSLSQARFIY